VRTDRVKYIMRVIKNIKQNLIHIYI
jgi:hypothetical protein